MESSTVMYNSICTFRNPQSSRYDGYDGRLNGAQRKCVCCVRVLGFNWATSQTKYRGQLKCVMLLVHSTWRNIIKLVFWQSHTILTARYYRSGLIDLRTGLWPTQIWPVAIYATNALLRTCIDLLKSGYTPREPVRSTKILVLELTYKGHRIDND